jgi:hypothetical protein
MRKSLRSSRQTKARGAALASTFALSVFAWTMPALGDPMGSANQTKYATLESFSSEFGSKFASGYFVSQTGKCLVTLMVTEKQDPEFPAKTTAARVRVELNPGQMAGVDSEERQSLNFTCAQDATALVVDRGERDALMAYQKRTLPSSAKLDWAVDGPQ